MPFSRWTLRTKCKPLPATRRLGRISTGSLPPAKLNGGGSPARATPMDAYLLTLLIGGVGLATMAVTGFGRHSHGGRAGGHGHSHGHAHSLGHGNAQAHALPGAHHTGATPAHPAPGGGGGGAHSMPAAIAALMSPRVLFSVLLGVGTAGLLLRPVLGGLTLLASAVAGGIAFERLLVAPLWNFALRFASKPALTLESAVTEEATAVTGFDANGQGIVAVEVDGQVVQVLGTLRQDDRTLGARVRAGDRVRIDEVDARRNRCTVSVL
jgi:hypothetical protein